MYLKRFGFEGVYCWQLFYKFVVISQMVSFYKFVVDVSSVFNISKENVPGVCEKQFHITFQEFTRNQFLGRRVTVHEAPDGIYQEKQFVGTTVLVDLSRQSQNFRNHSRFSKNRHDPDRFLKR